jgi:hypothetical protein
MRTGTAALGLIVLALAGSAMASPQSDFDAVYGDWKTDLTISACKWSEPQLQNAYKVANSNPDFQYETRFSDGLQTEIKRWKNGGCSGVAPISKRRTSPLSGARIVSVNGRGGARTEVVKIRNGTRKTISFRKATVRNIRSGKRNRSVFPARFKLAKGRTATVHMGCAKGKRHASFKARTVWLCRRAAMFRDKGDAARLADAKAIVVSQRGYGSQKRRPVF